jgi:hypothetical protein
MLIDKLLKMMKQYIYHKFNERIKILFTVEKQRNHLNLSVVLYLIPHFVM